MFAFYSNNEQFVVYGIFATSYITTKREP